MEKDILALSAAIQQYVRACSKTRKTDFIVFRLVDDLGLHSDLAQYKVPREDVPKIAEKAMGNRDDPSFPKVVKLLENLYP